MHFWFTDGAEAGSVPDCTRRVWHIGPLGPAYPLFPPPPLYNVVGLTPEVNARPERASTMHGSAHGVWQTWCRVESSIMNCRTPSTH